MFLVCGTPTYVAPEILDESGYVLNNNDEKIYDDSVVNHYYVLLLQIVISVFPSESAIL